MTINRSPFVNFQFSICSSHLLKSHQLLLEIVAAQGAIGQRTTNTVFAEAAWQDVHLAQEVVHGRIGRALALQFDDDDVANVGVALRLAVVEMHVEVDGETLRESLVNQCDTLKMVLHLRVKLVEREPRFLLNEIDGLGREQLVVVRDIGQ